MPTSPTPADRPADQPRAVLRLLEDAQSYLSVLHGAVGRHDHIGVNLACDGCALRDRITPALVVARQLLGTSVTEGATVDLEPQDHPGADLFVALQHAGLDDDEANRRMYAYARMVLRQEKAIAAPPAPVDRAAALREAADFVRDAHFRDGLTVQEITTALGHMAAAGVQPPTTTADRAAALSMTPTEYRQHSHTTAVQQIQAAAQGLLAETAIRVADALKEPAKACTCDFIDEPWIRMQHADDCPAAPAAPEEPTR